MFTDKNFKWFSVFQLFLQPLSPALFSACRLSATFSAYLMPIFGSVLTILLLVCPRLCQRYIAVMRLRSSASHVSALPYIYRFFPILSISFNKHTNSISSTASSCPLPPVWASFSLFFFQSLSLLLLQLLSLALALARVINHFHSYYSLHPALSLNLSLSQHFFQLLSFSLPFSFFSYLASSSSLFFFHSFPITFSLSYLPSILCYFSSPLFHFILFSLSLFSSLTHTQSLAHSIYLFFGLFHSLLFSFSLSFSSFFFLSKSFPNFLYFSPFLSSLSLLFSASITFSHFFSFPLLLCLSFSFSLCICLSLKSLLFAQFHVLSLSLFHSFYLVRSLSTSFHNSYSHSFCDFHFFFLFSSLSHTLLFLSLSLPPFRSLTFSNSLTPFHALHFYCALSLFPNLQILFFSPFLNSLFCVFLPLCLSSTSILSSTLSLSPLFSYLFYLFSQHCFFFVLLVLPHFLPLSVFFGPCLFLTLSHLSKRFFAHRISFFFQSLFLCTKFSILLQSSPSLASNLHICLLFLSSWLSLFLFLSCSFSFSLSLIFFIFRSFPLHSSLGLLHSLTSSAYCFLYRSFPPPSSHSSSVSVSISFLFNFTTFQFL